MVEGKKLLSGESSLLAGRKVTARLLHKEEEGRTMRKRFYPKTLGGKRCTPNHALAAETQKTKKKKSIWYAFKAKEEWSIKQGRQTRASWRRVWKGRGSYTQKGENLSHHKKEIGVIRLGKKKWWGKMGYIF